MKKKQQYIIRKYVMASSAIEAIKLEAKAPVSDVWLDDDWKKAQYEDKAPAIGFSSSADDTSEDYEH